MTTTTTTTTTNTTKTTTTTTAAPPAQPFSHKVIAGAVAGVSEICVMYPLDVVKTLAQLNATSEKVSVVSTIRNIVKNEGIGRLYRGLLPPILMEAPKRAVKFSSNDLYKTLFVSKKTGKLEQTGAILSGTCAGMTEAVVIVPFELVKVRLQAKENRAIYANTMDALAKILRNEGPLALYKGLESTVWRHAVWNSGYFGLIYTLQGMMPKAQSKTAKTMYDFTAGTIAGTFGTMLNTPFDVIKSRIQNQGAVVGQIPKYNWTLPALGIIAREEGVGALYKGFIPKVLRLGPGGGILLVVFDWTLNFLKNNSTKKE